MAAQRQRWIVLRSDDAGCTIEIAMVNELGRPTETPFVKEYAWVELRDHATYPAGFTTRDRATRDTPLGELEGWVYWLHDPEAKTLTEFFFADRYPGAPVIVRTTSEGLVVQELTQTARRPPR